MVLICALVTLMSVLLITPLAFTSSRKLEAVTGGYPGFDQTASVVLTIPLALTSPRSTPICGPTTLAILPGRIMHGV